MIASDFEVHDSRFRTLMQPNAPLQKLASDCLWAEGPVYFPAGDMVVWSDIPNNRMLRWAPGMGVGVFRTDSHHANGNTRDREGRMVSCEHGRRCVSRTEHDGSVTVLVSHYQGARFNSPNDVVVDSRGTIWFTDPDYGILGDYEGFRSPSEIGGCHVYALPDVAPGERARREGGGERGRAEVVEASEIAEAREAICVADDFVKPNGLAFSPDERLLYIADSAASHIENGPRHIRVFDVAPGPVPRLQNGRLFVELSDGIPDGLRVDEYGNVWTSAADGVHCYAPSGELLGKILIPETVSNLTFGGLHRNRLFITASTSLYSLHVGVRGAARS